MSTAEAVAWGYVGYLMMPDYGWFSGLLVGLMIFGLIWVLDTTLMMQDMGKNYYAKKLAPRWETDSEVPDWWRKENPANTSQWASVLDWFGPKFKLVVGGFGTRLALSAVSLVITAPFLALLVFSNDIQQQQISQADAQHKAAIAKTNIDFDARIALEKAKIDQLQAARNTEAAGKGESKRYGAAAVVAQQNKQIKFATEEYEAIKRRLNNEREKTLQLIKPATPEALSPLEAKFQAMNALRNKGKAADYKPPQGVWANLLEIVSHIFSPPENAFERNESAIRAMLLFIITALVILKILEPESVRLYLSETMQSLFQRYISSEEFSTGNPDVPASRTERANNPIQFQNWALGQYGFFAGQEVSRNPSQAKITREMRARLNAGATQSTLFDVEQQQSRILRGQPPISNSAAGQTVESAEQELHNMMMTLDQALNSTQQPIEQPVPTKGSN